MSDPSPVLPKTGDCYTCECCGMSLIITCDCGVDPEHTPSLVCCGEPLTRVDCLSPPENN